MATHITVQFSSDALKTLDEIQKEVRTKEAGRIRSIMQNLWLRELEQSPHPMTILLDGREIKNKALVEWEQAQKMVSLEIRYQELLRMRDTHISVLTEKVMELHKVSAAREPLAPNEAPYLLTFWKAISIRPGAFGFSVDLKALVADSLRIIKEHRRFIQLGLNSQNKQ